MQTSLDKSRICFEQRSIKQLNIHGICLVPRRSYFLNSSLVCLRVYIAFKRQAQHNITDTSDQCKFTLSVSEDNTKNLKLTLYNCIPSSVLLSRRSPDRPMQVYVERLNTKYDELETHLICHSSRPQIDNEGRASQHHHTKGEREGEKVFVVTHVVGV